MPNIPDLDTAIGDTSPRTFPSLVWSFLLRLSVQVFGSGLCRHVSLRFASVLVAQAFGRLALTDHGGREVVSSVRAGPSPKLPPQLLFPLGRRLV